MILVFVRSFFMFHLLAVITNGASSLRASKIRWLCWACQLRTRFVRAGDVPDSGRARKGGRRHENMTRDEEVALLARQSRYLGS